MKYKKNLIIITAPLAKQFVECAIDLSLPVEQYLRDCGYPQYIEQVFNSNVEMVAGYPILYIISRAEQAGISDFSIQVASKYGLSIVAPLFDFLTLNSTHLLEFIHLLVIESNKFISTPVYFLEFVHDGVFLVRKTGEEFETGEHGMELYIITLFVLMIRAFLEVEWQPSIIWLKRDKVDFTKPQAIENSQMFWSKNSTRIFFSKNELKLIRRRQVTQHNPYVSPDTNTQKASVLITQALKPFANKSLPTLNQLSNMFGLQTRYLQRKLAVENTTYRQLINEIKYERAAKLLTKTTRDLNKISFELGYKNLTHFSRAFKKISGVTPTEFRHMK